MDKKELVWSFIKDREYFPMKFKEIAKLVGGLETSVRWQYNNALKKIKTAYERRNV